jgi:hypothetical protein
MTDSGSDPDAAPEPDSTADMSADAATSVQTISTPAKVIGKFDDSTDGAAGVYGWNTADTGSTRGVIGKVDSDDVNAAGVRGESTSTSGTSSGVSGRAQNGIGVYGGSDNGTGVRGETGGENTGVYGIGKRQSGFCIGVFGSTFSSEGYGVYGEALSDSGTNYGVYGETDSDDGTADDGYGVFSKGQLAVERDVAFDGDFRRHAATITNTSGDSNGDVLGLRVQVTDPGPNMNFISFTTDANGQIGQVEGDGSGGVNYKSASSDLAEYFPMADPAASFDSGDVVGLDAGELVADPTAAEEALVVSKAPMVTGNAPMDEDDDGMACVALLGQVPVRIGAPVEAGDLLVATPEGTAVPRSDRNGDAPVVGRTLEAGEAGATAKTFVTARVTDDAPTAGTATEPESTPELLTQGGQPTKVIGRLSDTDGIGVLGEATGSGTTYGVLGQASSSYGYGLATPDDAEIEGRVDTNETDFVVEAGTQSTEDAQNVVLGHASNAVTGGADGATISGGGFDDGLTDLSNEVTASYGTVGGGYENTASGRLATVAGGSYNTASDRYATVAGGRLNTASGNRATVAGGQSNTASGSKATVAGGSYNTASGKHSFAAGRRAEAGHEGTFVWSDSDISGFSSDGDNQFLVEADGGMGVGTNAPGSQLHVTDTLAENNTNPSGHVATIENESDSGSADVLLLQTGKDKPGGTNNYVTFADANGAIGAIEGKGSGGIEYKSGSADIAEYFPAATPDAEFDTGSVVGLADGEIRRDPTAADAALVVSDAPMLTGNVPDYGEAETAEQSVCVALLGQVPVRVGAAVSAGDLLVATADGTAVPADTREDSPPVVGRALEDGAADDTVTTFVNARAETDRADRMQDLEQRLADRDDRIQELEAENEALRDRLTDFEERLASLEADQVPTATADD